jgi:hypothetical protein
VTKDFSSWEAIEKEAESLDEFLADWEKRKRVRDEEHEKMSDFLTWCLLGLIGICILSLSIYVGYVIFIAF